MAAGKAGLLWLFFAVGIFAPAEFRFDKSVDFGRCYQFAVGIENVRFATGLGNFGQTGGAGVFVIDFISENLYLSAVKRGDNLVGVANVGPGCYKPK